MVAASSQSSSVRSGLFVEMIFGQFLELQRSVLSNATGRPDGARRLLMMSSRYKQVIPPELILSSPRARLRVAHILDLPIHTLSPPPGSELITIHHSLFTIHQLHCLADRVLDGAPIITKDIFGRC